MAKATTTQYPISVPCPGRERGVCAEPAGHEHVAVLTSPSAKTVRLAACRSLVAQGWSGHQIAVRKGDEVSEGLYGLR
jgi:hypothetical protein